MDRSALEKKIWKLFEQGLTDNEILDQLVTEQSEELTYMELRVLRADYEAEHPETVEEDDEPIEELEETDLDEGQPAIEFDSIRKPGSLASGTANLPSGARVSWALDQFGRINLQPVGDDKPTQEDMQVFQETFRQELERRGGVV